LRIKKMVNQRYLDNELVIKKERISQKKDVRIDKKKGME
jgi:hypothetical protein